MRLVAALALATILVGCSHESNTVVQAPGGAGFSPFIQQQNNQNGWLSFPMTASAVCIAAGHDGNIWASLSDSTIARFDMTGSQTTFSIGDGSYSCDGGMTPNPDGNLYMAYIHTLDQSIGIAQINQQGQAQFFPAPFPAVLVSIVTGSDQNIWVVTEPNQGSSSVYRMSTTGQWTHLQDLNVQLRGIARGPDKNIWSSDSTGYVRLAIADGSPAFYTATPAGLTLGSDDAFWGATSKVIYRFDPSTGIQSSFVTTAKQAVNMVADGSYLYWNSPLSSGKSNIYKWGVKSNRLVGNTKANIYFGHLTIGPDSQLWMGAIEDTNMHVRIIHLIVPTPTSLSIANGSSAPLSVVEQGSLQRSFTAVSDNTKVATVSGSGESFTVTAVAPGNADVTISDQIGNSESVPVTVN